MNFNEFDFVFEYGFAYGIRQWEEKERVKSCLEDFILEDKSSITLRPNFDIDLNKIKQKGNKKAAR